MPRARRRGVVFQRPPFNHQHFFRRTMIFTLAEIVVRRKKCGVCHGRRPRGADRACGTRLRAFLGGRTGVTAEACHHLLSVPAMPCGSRTPLLHTPPGAVPALAPSDPTMERFPSRRPDGRNGRSDQECIAALRGPHLPSPMDVYFVSGRFEGGTPPCRFTLATARRAPSACCANPPLRRRPAPRRAPHTSTTRSAAFAPRRRCRAS
jgi:hypothetical protein